ncbi:MAG: ATP-binding protein, partial [Candidatus Thermoplasmatota archaeon]|nr:ATP-binding protein [Candidatus Thermoplasmatota archaeon]
MTENASMTDLFNMIYEEQMSLFGKKEVFFIDEVQNVDGFEMFVRRFQEKGLKIFLTGSNANLLSMELGTKLSGRHLRMDLTPFSFREYLDFIGLKIDNGSIYETEKRVLIRKAFNDYLDKGGMPEYLKYGDQEILLRTYEDIVVKDIAVRYSIDNIKGLKDLYNYLISNLTNRFTYNSLRKVVDIASGTTVKNYVHYLELANFCQVVIGYDNSLKKQMNAQKKFYLTDHGFLRPISTMLSRDYGKVLENIILRNMSCKGKVFFHGTGWECDIIIIRQNKVQAAVQVTWKMNDANRKREINGLVKTMDAFKLDLGYLITNDHEETIETSGKIIKVIPAWKFILTEPLADGLPPHSSPQGSS